VEDNLVLQRMLKKWFEKLNVKVTQAFDGKQAVELCQKHKYSLIFMDVAMPIMDGEEATRLIR
jgi:CheY-like chemotaxis protein